MEALVKSCNICWVWSGMPGHAKPQNNKVSISLGRVELFCVFVACNYTSMEAAALSCHFSWLWSYMPRIL